jgi:hypothetical protein
MNYGPVEGVKRQRSLFVFATIRLDLSKQSLRSAPGVLERIMFVCCDRRDQASASLAQIYATVKTFSKLNCDSLP